MNDFTGISCRQRLRGLLDLISIVRGRQNWSSLINDYLPSIH
jgi:hypothetical protein